MKKGKIIALVCTLLLTISAAFTGVFAKYIYEAIYGGNQATLEDFFFTTDLMHNSYSDLNDEYTNELTVPVYGTVEDSNRLAFKVINYYDILRVNTQQITYKLNLKATQYNDNGTTTDVSSNYSIIQTIDSVETTKASGTEYKIGKNTTEVDPTPLAEEHSFKIRTNSSVNYVVNYKTNIQLTIAASHPFKKTLTINYDLYPDVKGIDVRIQDAPGVLYAELVIENNDSKIEGMSIVVSLDLITDGTLLFDSSNPKVTPTYGGTYPTQYPTQLTINTTINQDGSFSLILFKTDITQDYSSLNLVCSNVGTYFQITVQD